MENKTYALIRGVDVIMLRTFDALLREGSVSKAAARLFLSQPAVSACLKRLRLVFDDELFTRSKNGVVPTNKALALAPQVEKVLEELQRLVTLNQVFSPATSDRILRIAGSDHTCRTLLPTLSRNLTALGSSIKVSWSLPNYNRYAEDLAKGNIDLALIPKMTQVTGVQSQLLGEDAYICVAREGHPLFASDINLDSFCSFPQVALGQTRSVLEDTIDGTLTRLGRRRHVQVTVTSFSQMADLLDRTDLIAVFPQRVAKRYAGVLASGRLPFELPNYRLYLCWHKRSEADSAFNWLKEQILQTIELTL